MTEAAALLDPRQDSVTADDLAHASREIERSQRQIVRGVSELAEGIVNLSLALLDVRRRRLYRFDSSYPTFEDYVQQRHGISARQANVYVEALSSLGETQFRTLVSDVGLQRTYALALLNRAEPELVTAFQRLPDNERHAITAAQITAVDTAVTSDLATRVSQLEHEITRGQGLLQQTRRRLADAEELHQRVTNNLIEERDLVRIELAEEQQQTDRLRTLLAEAKRQPGSRPPTRLAAQPEATPSADSIAEAVVVQLTCDLPSLVIDVRAVGAKLAATSAIARSDIADAQRKSLVAALQELDEAVQDALDRLT